MIELWDHIAMECPSSIHWFANKTVARGSEWWTLPLMGEDHRSIFDFFYALIGEWLFVMGSYEWKRDYAKFFVTNKVSILNA